MFFVLKGLLFELETIYFNTLIRLRKNIIMTFRTLQKMIDKKKNSWPLNCLGPCSPGLMSKEICCLIIWKEMFYLVSVDFVQFVPIHTSHKVAYWDQFSFFTKLLKVINPSNRPRFRLFTALIIDLSQVDVFDWNTVMLVTSYTRRREKRPLRILPNTVFIFPP